MSFRSTQRRYSFATSQIGDSHQHLVGEVDDMAVFDAPARPAGPSRARCLTSSPAPDRNSLEGRTRRNGAGGGGVGGEGRYGRRAGEEGTNGEGELHGWASIDLQKSERLCCFGRADFWTTCVCHVTLKSKACQRGVRQTVERGPRNARGLFSASFCRMEFS